MTLPPTSFENSCTLGVGDKAPDFSLKISDDRVFSLSQHLTMLRHDQLLLLYFYPKNFTSGCTDQACQFRDAIFHNDRFSIVGVSRDTLSSHEKFQKVYDLPFVTLSDVAGDVCRLYGCWVEKSMYGKRYFGIERSTFVINASGNIVALWQKVKVKNHVQDILSLL